MKCLESLALKSRSQLRGEEPCPGSSEKVSAIDSFTKLASTPSLRFWLTIYGSIFAWSVVHIMFHSQLRSTCTLWRRTTAYRLQRAYATESASGPAIAPTSLRNADELLPPASQVDLSKLRIPKPRTPGLRHLRIPINDHLWKGRPYYPLTFPRKGQGIGGRNNTGRLVVRHRGGGHKRRIRKVDFARKTPGRHVVERIEHDPGRGAHIAFISNVETQEKSYILASEGMREGHFVESYIQGIPDELIQSAGGTQALGMIILNTIIEGNCLPLRLIPTGTKIFNIELRPRRGGQLCRGAGSSATVLGEASSDDPRYEKYMNVQLQSGEIRRIHKDAGATIGVASNGNRRMRQLGKAGRSRWLGIRPTVRGVAMNANDHPHGGGRGKSKGNVNPVSIWGRTLVGQHATVIPVVLITH